MVKVRYNEEEKQWKILPKHSEEGIYINDFLMQKLLNIKKIISKNWDAVICIDGFERSGKSTLGMTIGYFLSDTKLSINNFAAGLDDAAKKIKDLPDKSVLIVDEGSLVFNSKDTMKRQNIKLGKILDVIGQKNMVFIIILPSFFNLNKDIAVRRSRFLLHVVADQETMQRGNFFYYGERAKSILYNLGKKNFGSYSQPDPDFPGSFTDFKPGFYKEYLELKKQSMLEALGEEKTISKSEHSSIEREIKKELICNFIKNCPEITLKQIARGFGTSKSSIHRYKQGFLGVSGVSADAIYILPSEEDKNCVDNGEEEIL